MIYRFRLALTVLVAMITGCVNTQQQFNAAKPNFYDQGFASAAGIKLESEQQIFYLDQQAKQFALDVTAPYARPADKIEALALAIFSRTNLNLLYQGDANTPANDTFHARAANCLSLSIMAYALARQAGFEAQFQEIKIPEYWTRRQGYNLLNGHINLVVSSKNRAGPFALQPSVYQIDFDPQNYDVPTQKQALSKREIIAMYYNNKGADALLKGLHSLAYAYFKSALELTPKFDAGWINMGVLYRHAGYFSESEKAYRYALTINPDNLTSWENLARLYKKTDRQQQAAEIFERVQQARQSNPYYYVNLGEEQFDLQNWELALGHFRHALGLDRKIHQVHFGMAKVYFEMGEIDKSKQHLKQARATSSNTQLADNYAKKLLFLQNLPH